MSTRDVAAVIGGLAVAAGLAFGAAFIIGRGRGGVGLERAAQAGIATKTSTAPRARAALAEDVIADEVLAGERAVPLDVLRTASVTAAPWAPGLRLVRTATSAEEWEARRAHVEDRTTGDVREYAIGDLLPHGSLLVGIADGAVEIMVADTHLVVLFTDGRVEPVQDLSEAFEPEALKPAHEVDPDYEDQVRVALIDLRSGDPSIVQAAIDRLIAAGDPAVEMMIEQVDSIVPVRAAEYAFPSASGVEMRPHVVGEIVMMVLERITGQTFGDLTKEDLPDEQRLAIARAWLRWWNGE